MKGPVIGDSTQIQTHCKNGLGGLGPLTKSDSTLKVAPIAASGSVCA